MAPRKKAKKLREYTISYYHNISGKILEEKIHATEVTVIDTPDGAVLFLGDTDGVVFALPVAALNFIKVMPKQSKPARIASKGALSVL